jgi:carboxymethylenebutenolidase
MYYRKAREFRMVRDEEGFKRMFAMMDHLSIDLVMRDTQAMLDFVDRQKAAKADSIGTVGYCMSGPYVFAAAGRFPERVKCAASIYGVRLFTDAADSPHLLADKVKGELYFGCAETDKYAPKEMIDKLEAHLKGTPGLRSRVEWYMGVEHGFAFPLRAGIFNKPAAERHWERLFALFKRNLG